MIDRKLDFREGGSGGRCTVGNPRRPIVPSRKVKVRRRAQQAKAGDPSKSGAAFIALQGKRAFMLGKRVNARQNASKTYPELGYALNRYLLSFAK
jgi:hypothetical protein